MEIGGWNAADWIAIVVALGAFVGALVTRKSKSDAHNVNETVDGTVLGRFAELFNRIRILEEDLADTKINLAKALAELEQMRKLEEYLQAKLHEKDLEVAELRTTREKNKSEIGFLRRELKRAEARIAHLEQVCRRAGINGDDMEEQL